MVIRNENLYFKHRTTQDMKIRKTFHNNKHEQKIKKTFLRKNSATLSTGWNRDDKKKNKIIVNNTSMHAHVCSVS